MATKFWTNQTVKMQSAIGAAVTITGISKASDGVVTTAGTLPANGAYVLLEVTGMREVNNRIFKVSGSGGGQFNIGEDTTNFTDFSAGTFRVVTIDIFFAGLREPQSSGGDAIFEDTTTIHDRSDTQAVVGTSPLSYSFTNDWSATDPALRACNTAFYTGAPRAIVIVDPDGDEFAFYATVAAALNPTQAGKKKVTPITFSLLAPGTVI